MTLTYQRHDRSIAVLFIDVDRFKEVNDGISHAVYDEVLQKLAAVLLHRSATGTAWAPGGDEFAVVLHQINNEQEAAEYAERLRSAIARCGLLESRPARTRNRQHWDCSLAWRANGARHSQ